MTKCVHVVQTTFFTRTVLQKSKHKFFDAFILFISMKLTVAHESERGNHVLI